MDQISRNASRSVSLHCRHDASRLTGLIHRDRMLSVGPSSFRRHFSFLTDISLVGFDHLPKHPPSRRCQSLS